MTGQHRDHSIATCAVVLVAILCLTVLAINAMDHGIDGLLLTGVSAAIAGLAAGLTGFHLRDVFRK